MLLRGSSKMGGSVEVRLLGPRIPPEGGDRGLPEASSSPLLSVIWVTELSCLVVRLSWTDARSWSTVLVNTHRLGKPCILKGFGPVEPSFCEKSASFGRRDVV